MGIRRVYVEANTISPGQARRIAGLLPGVRAVVDAAIVGPPPTGGRTATMYLSGPAAATAEVAALFTGTAVRTKILGPEVGQASAVKLTYAAFGSRQAPHDTEMTAVLPPPEVLREAANIFWLWDQAEAYGLTRDAPEDSDWTDVFGARRSGGTAPDLASVDQWLVPPGSHWSHFGDPAGDEDDDALIAQLADRARDPGRSFDTAPVPVAWLIEHYGDNHVDTLRTSITSYRSDGSVTLPAGTAEVTAFYADAPRGTLFPPATADDVADAEHQLGYPLPDLLRRLYTEVADGGFGPGGGIASLRPGRRPQGRLYDWPYALRTHRALHGQGTPRQEPSSWLYLASAGCSIELHVSLIALDNPVLLYDYEGWEPSWGEGPHDSIRQATPLRRWLANWAAGGDG